MTELSSGVPKKLGKRFKLVRRIRSDQQSHVFEVLDRSREQSLVLRLLAWTEQSAVLARFKQEFRLLSELRHPNLVPVHDFEVIPGDCAFFTMDLCPGRWLHKVVQPADFQKWLPVFWEICQTLDFLHSRGVVPGALTPHSILVDEGPVPETGSALRLRPQPEARIRFVTLGLETDLSLEAGPIADWMHYMAPEAALGRPLDLRANLYSLGVLLYELMTGRRPFEAESPVELMRQHLRQAPVSPRQIRPDMPLELENLVLRLLEKRPSRRFQSAAEVAHALGEAGGTLASVAARPLRSNLVFTGELIGRQKEFGKLKNAYRAARQGRGSVVLITGEAGIGKSRLIQEFRVFLQLEGEIVLHTASVPRARMPYQEIDELLRQLLLRFEKSQSALVEHYRSERLMRLEAVARGPEAKGRAQILEALLDVFLELATAQPYAVVLDDLHWADEETLELLGTLCTRLVQHPILLVLAFENSEPDRPHPLHRWTEMAETRAEVLILGRLGKSETGQLLQSLLGLYQPPARLTRRIHQETEGNPFFVEEVVKSLVDQGRIRQPALDQDLLPDDVALIPGSIVEAMKQRLALLNPLQLELLQVLAVFGQSIDLDLLAQTSGQEPGGLQTALLELQDRQILQVHPSAGEAHWRFSHAKIGEVLVRQIQPETRRRLHARLAENLVRRQDASAAGVIAHHCLEGGLPAEAVEWGVRAARAAAGLFAFRKAITEYERVLTELSDWIEPAEAAGLREELGDLYAQTGAAEKALDCFAVLLRDRNQSALLRKISRCHRLLSQPESALRAARQSLEAAGTDRVQQVESLAEIGRLEMMGGQLWTGLETGLYAMQILPGDGDCLAAARLWLVLAEGLLELGQAAAAVDRLREALRLFESQEDLQGIAWALTGLGRAYGILGQIGPASESFEKSQKLFQRLGHRFGLAWTDRAWGECLGRLTGDWERAAQLLQQATSLSVALGDRAATVLARLRGAELETVRGHWAQAQTMLELLGRELQPQESAQLRMARGALHLAQGHAGSALLELQAAQSDLDQGGFEMQRDRSRLLLAETLALLGRTEEARSLLEGLQTQLEARQNLPEWIVALRLRGELELARGRPGAGLEMLRQAERVAKELGCEPELGKIWIRLALCHRQTHDLRAAVEALKRAEHLFKGLGAVALSAEVEQQLSALHEEPVLRRLEDPSQDLFQLYRISQLLSPILDPELLEKRLLELAVESVGADRGLLISDGPELEVLASQGHREEEVEAFSRSIVRRALAEGKPLLSMEATQDPRFSTTLSIEVLEVHSVLCVPLPLAEREAGVLYLTSSSGTRVFSEQDLDFLSALANHAAVALKNAGLYRRFESILDGIDVGVVATDSEGRVRQFSREAERILGLGESEIAGRAAATVFRRSAETELGRVLEETLGRGEGMQRELGFRHHDEPQRRWLEVTTAVLRDGYGEAVGSTAIFEEVTDVKRLRAELELQRRLSAMGQLAAQVAHKMKNLLSGIKLLSQGLRRECAAGQPETVLVDRILTEVGHAETTIYEQLNLSRAVAEPEPVDLAVLLSEAVRLCRGAPEAHGIPIDLEIAGPMPEIVCSRKQMTDSLRGVVQNAIEAWVAGGRIQAVCCYEDGRSTPAEPTARGCIRIEIRDQGQGIASEHLGSIFDPFFTTKPGAAGIGLWLFHRTVQGLKGRVEVETEVGRGTLLRCWVPVPSEGRWQRILQLPEDPEGPEDA